MAQETGSTDDRMWSHVVTLYGRVELELATALQRRHRLGLSEYRALYHLAGSTEGELRIQELADVLGLNQSSVSRLVARLERDGLAKRDVCANDRRGVYAVITSAGRELQTAARPTYEETLMGVLDRAGLDPELAGLVSALRG